MNMDKATAPASIAAPRPKIKTPMQIPFGRPSRSATYPAKNDDSAAGIRMQDTIRPWIVEFSLPPNEALKYSISVTGPMVPVSMPKSRPFAEQRMHPSRYFGGLLMFAGINPILSGCRFAMCGIL
jgi:hypothetical protein